MSEGCTRSIAAMLLCAILVLVFLPLKTSRAKGLSATAKAYILMEAETGTVIDAKNEQEALYGAGITKLMSFLLFFEALQNGTVKIDEVISVSQEASSKRGTSAFLDAGETHSFGDLLKAAIVCSANDATCALAERIAGSESAFTEQMNAKAELLGIDAVFADCTGLSTESKASAQAFAIIAAKLSTYNSFFEYSTCWTFTFVHNSGRETEITNGNTLVRNGTCDGMATGSTAESGYHMVASGKSGPARFIFVILGDKDAASRAAAANQAISQAAAAYGVKQVAQKDAKYRSVPLENTEEGVVDIYPSEDMAILYKKGEENLIRIQVEIEEFQPPLVQGQIVGKIIAETPGGQQSVALEVREEVKVRSIKGGAGRILRIWLFGL